MRHIFLILLFFTQVAFGGSGFIGPALFEGQEITATSGGTKTLTSASETVQVFTGSSNHTLVLPDATTFPKVGRYFYIWNEGTGTITVNKNGGTLLTTVPGPGSTRVYNSNIGTSAGIWDVQSNSLDLSSSLALGVLPINKGGTGQTTANAALNGFLPTQTGNAAKFLKTDGTNSSWADAFTLSTFGTVASPRLLAVATGITSGAGHMSTTAPMQIVIIKNTNSYYEAVTANPQIEAGTILGQQMRVVWASSSAIVSFATGNGIDLNGSWWPVNGSTLDLYWNGSVWSEYTRSDR